MGVGTTSGVRIVVGMWDRSPFGAFTDVFLELPDGTSVLLAPDEIVAAYVSGTYRFDTVSVVDVRARRTARGLELDAGALQVSVDVGTISPLGRLLRIVPKPVARDPRWLAAIDPIARLVAPGSGTAGSAGNGRREYYGVTGAHDVTGVRGTWAGGAPRNARAARPTRRVRLRLDAAGPAGRRRRDHHPRARLTLADPCVRMIRAGRGAGPANRPPARPDVPAGAGAGLPVGVVPSRAGRAQREGAHWRERYGPAGPAVERRDGWGARRKGAS